MTRASDGRWSGAACVLVVLLANLNAQVVRAASFAYLINGGDETVSVIDTSTRSVVATIPVPGPSRLVVQPDGRIIYVTTTTDDINVLGVSVIDAASNSVTRTFRLPQYTGSIQVHPDRKHFVALTGGCPGQFLVLDIETLETAVALPVGCDPTGRMVVTADGSRAYVLNGFDPNPDHPCQLDRTSCELDVSVLDLVNMRALAPIRNVGAILEDVAADPLGRGVYVAAFAKGIRPPHGGFAFSFGLAFIGIDDATVARYLPVDGSALRIAVPPAGAPLYVFGNSEIFFVDPDSVTPAERALLFGNGTDMAMTPDGSALYATLADSEPATRDEVAVVDTASRAVVTRIPVGRFPGQIAIGPDVAITPLPTATPAPLACIGDCDSSGGVGIDELIRGVRIALGSVPLGQCAACDANGDGEVTINELVRAVNSALDGCPKASRAVALNLAGDPAYAKRPPVHA